MLKITSRDNKKLKNARKVRDGRIKNAIFVEGFRLVSEALKSNLKFSEVFISENFFANGQNSSLLDEIRTIDAEVFIISEKLFNTIADTKSSQGIVLIGVMPPNGQATIQSAIDENKSEQSIVLLLHKINNPSNLGAILRTAEASGVIGIITTKSSAKVFSPKALRGAMGASFRIPICENAEFDEALDFANTNNLTTICADINAKKSYSETNWNKTYLLVFGSESHGLSEIEFNKIEEKIFIPMENNVESLNLSVACGIILFEAKK